MNRRCSLLLVCLLVFGFFLSCFSVEVQAISHGGFVLDEGYTDLLAHNSSIYYASTHPVFVNSYTDVRRISINSWSYTYICCNYLSDDSHYFYIKLMDDYYAFSKYDYYVQVDYGFADKNVPVLEADAGIFQYRDAYLTNTKTGVSYDAISSDYDSNRSFGRSLFKMSVSEDNSFNFGLYLFLNIAEAKAKYFYILSYTVTAVLRSDSNDVVQAIENQYDDSKKGEFQQGLENQQQGTKNSMGSLGDETVIKGVSDIFTASPGPATLVFPAFSIDVEGEKHQIWKETKFEFDIIEEHFPVLISAVRMILATLVYLALIQYVHKTYEGIFGGK